MFVFHLVKIFAFVVEQGSCTLETITSSKPFCLKGFAKIRQKKRKERTKQTRGKKTQIVRIAERKSQTHTHTHTNRKTFTFTNKDTLHTYTDKQKGLYLHMESKILK